MWASGMWFLTWVSDMWVSDMQISSMQVFGWLLDLPYHSPESLFSPRG